MLAQLSKAKSHSISNMSFTLTTFAELCTKYATWDSLKAYLISDEGGKLRIIEPENSHLAIVRYTKGVSNFSKPHVADFRSVVWNKTTNRPVSVAPVKAVDDMPPADVTVRVSDFVDGTMIQAWVEDGAAAAGASVGAGAGAAPGAAPQLATRTSLNARGTFYSKRTFAEMFDDALKNSGGSQKFLESVLQPGQFAASGSSSRLGAMFSSFVLQHKEHKTVAPIAYNRVFCICTGSVSEDGTVTFNTSPDGWPERLRSYAPECYAESDTLSQPRKMLTDHQSQGYTWQGLVFQDLASSRRWRLRNPSYTVVRSLRGAEADPVARFIRLRAASQTKQYLSYFREESNEMWGYEQLLRQRTSDLYTAYNEMNKLKQKSMKDLPYSLRPHVYALHGQYLASLPKNGVDDGKHAIPVLKQVVIDYVNKLSLEDQVKLMGPLVLPQPMQPMSPMQPVPIVATS